MSAAVIDYTGKRVVVTGSSSGIGAAVAASLADLGAEVHGAALTGSADGLASFTELDLADPASVQDAVSSIGGSVDALFNCAGATPMIDPVELLKINFLGTRLLTELFVPSMPAGSAVVSVSSDGGFGWRAKRKLILDFLAVDGFDGGVDWYRKNQTEAGHSYAFGKEALNVWTMLQSAELIHRGVRTNVVSPGAVQTPMLEAIEDAYTAAAVDAVLHPIGRRSTPHEQVGPILFLGSSAASYVNGIDLQVDGGFWASRSVDGQIA